jgi:thermitase
MCPRPFSLPTDGPVYDPELAHCCSCEPERAAASTIRMEKERAEAMLACLEVRRRQLLLQKGELAPFAS